MWTLACLALPLAARPGRVGDPNLDPPLDCTPVTASSRLDTSGSYCLTEDVTASEGLTIRASDVTLDLRGHCLYGPRTLDTQAVGVTVAGGVHDVTIAGGCIEGFMYGVRAEPSPDGLRSSRITLRDLDLRSHTFRGARLAASEAVVIDSRIAHIGGSHVFDDAYAIGIEISGNDCLVSRNVLREIYPRDSGEGVGIAVSEAWTERCRVERNDVRNSRIPDWGRTFGIWARGNTTAHANLVMNQTFSIAGGADARLPRNVSVHEACGDERVRRALTLADTVYVRGRLPCSERLEYALRRVVPGNHNTLFKVAAIHHFWGRYSDALPYYYAAGVAGSAEAARQVKRFLELGLVTPADVDALDDRARAMGLLPQPGP